MVLEGTSDLFYLANQSSGSFTSDHASTEEVNVLTLDSFWQDRNINHISYLKIDTEGGDLNVLKGGEKLLAEQRIDFVEVEAGMNAYNKRHVPFETLKSYLEAKNYFLFGIYEQVQEWPTQHTHLRRVNSVFMSRTMIDRSK